MRTTITIEDAVVEQLKARPAREDTAVSRLIENSVRLAARSQGEGDDASLPFE